MKSNILEETQSVHSVSWYLSMLICFYATTSSWWITCNMGAWSALSMATRVSIVKLWVPRIHLLISASFLSRSRARSFYFNPLLVRISWIRSTIWNERSTDSRISGFTCLRRFSKILLLFIAYKIQITYNLFVNQNNRTIAYTWGNKAARVYQKFHIRSQLFAFLPSGGIFHTSVSVSSSPSRCML